MLSTLAQLRLMFKGIYIILNNFRDSSDTKWIIVGAIIGTVVIVGIGWYIYKKKKSQTQDTLL